MKHQPTRTPLTSVEEVGTHRGRRILAARYPSATSDEIWTCTIDDSGHPIGCDCRAGQQHYQCWHQFDAANAVVAYFKHLYGTVRPMNERQLADHAEHLQRYLSYVLDADDREAAELEAIAVRQLRAAMRLEHSEARAEWLRKCLSRWDVWAGFWLAWWNVKEWM